MLRKAINSKGLAYLALLFTVACTPLKHKTIDKTYHGTNGTGGYWLAWLTQDVVKGDSVIIRVTGYNVEEHKAEISNALLLLENGEPRQPKVIKGPTGTKQVRVSPGKYLIGLIPTRLAFPIRTKYFKLKAGDSLTVAFNSVWNYQPPLVDKALYKNGLEEYYKMVERAEKEEAKRKRKEARKQKRKKNE